MDKLVRMGTLFDFYGKLLSNRQFVAIELYYVHDFSLAEIGEELGVSRQSIYDTLKRAENNLLGYEKTLGLIERFNCKKAEIDELNIIINEIELEFKKKDSVIMKERIEDLRTMINKIMEGN